MAKLKQKGKKSKRKEKPKRKDKSGPLPKGTALRTWRAASFFFDQAGWVDHPFEHHEYYIEAAVVFAWMSLEHLKVEYGEDSAAMQWIENQLENNPLIDDLRRKRNLISHERPTGIFPSQKEGLTSDEPSPEVEETQERLPDQLKAVETIISNCGKLY